MNPWECVLESNLKDSNNTNYETIGKTYKKWSSSNVKAIFYHDDLDINDEELKKQFSGYYQIASKQEEVYVGGRWPRYQIIIFPKVKIYNDTWVEWPKGSWLVKAKNNKIFIMESEMFKNLFMPCEGTDETPNENVIRWDIETPKDTQPEVKPEEPSWTKDSCISWGTEKEEPDEEPELEYEYDGDTTFDPYEKKESSL